ncbi:hypothetical protein SBA3_2740027 [Candidatus Sulfopaludibacter sp. SbA3]|nr:hypothetical protein SBA3_2740027 [Candidatus Sulfopaludibacter sp. SbA3]
MCAHRYTFDCPDHARTQSQYLRPGDKKGGKPSVKTKVFLRLIRYIFVMATRALRNPYGFFTPSPLYFRLTWVAS